MIERLGLRLRVLLIFAGLLAGALAALVGGLWLGWSRQAEAGVVPALELGGIAAGLVIAGLVVGVWYLFDLNVARPIDSLASALRARAHADVASEMDGEIARYLGDLAPAASAAAQRLAETRNALAEAVARETTRLADEKARLETLLSDAPVGVVLCTGAHRLVFYNSQAVDLLGTGAAPGLERNLFDYLHAGPIRLAHRRLIEGGEPDAASDLLCTTVVGARVLAARMRLLAEGGAEPGYVLTLRDVTSDLAALASREALLSEMLDRMRRPAANLQTLLQVVPEGEALPPDLGAAVRQEVAGLAAAVRDLGARHEAGRSEGWPVAFVRAADLVDGLRARIEAAGLPVTAEAAELLLRCNGFELIALVSRLAGQVAAAGLAAGFAVSLDEEEGGAMLRLSWKGAALPVGRLDRWLAEPVDPGGLEVTGQAILASHATEAWPERHGDRACICLPIRQARRAGRRPKPIARAVVYDFDLLSKVRNEKVADSRLEDLTYVVFDSETTGLMPQQDEMVQLAAVRIVNGRRVEGEIFDTLVNPGRPIPPASTEVHGISDAMVADAPGVAEVVRRFHAFAEGAVLIAHNAPFDMEFLRRAEFAIGKRFDNPILDTVLLSAVVYGQTEVHSLDALTHRLGITIPEEARHTAIGDTVATADAFLKLVQILKARGIVTFGEVLTEVRRHGRLMKDLNG